MCCSKSAHQIALATVGLVTSVTISLLVVTPLHAQSKTDWGLKTGVNVSNLDGDWCSFSEVTPKFGFLLGGYMRKPLNDRIYIQPELMIVSKGVKREATMFLFDKTFHFIETASLTYIEIPVLFEFPVPTRNAVKPSLFVGPAFGLGLMGKNGGQYSVSSSTSLGSYSFSGDLGNLRKLDFSVVIGAALDFRIGTKILSFDLRYSRAITGALDWDGGMESIAPGDIPLIDIATNELLDLQNESISISIGMLIS